ncbi:SusC/RagA family TonB-linked outer membrane protein [Chitinophaga polysaccharea]|uniref:SusC/RagA family TonB-linked outer membrane protein n=1 Tax=Chitinophaga TaxID=79328 RepID=UPI001455A129|nr:MULTISPECIES: SusC/RagA family TonB-linked outer membrane protein [Chitinophaga]NLR56855.1 SusC/RagA family TonB-linked outer membrane protein [Chitinophaga polysaccharea]NLU93077.1 SusC/RagA family TonB-linked outer membrane protein [Chitinophaga sp. Ak27]
MKRKIEGLRWLLGTLCLLLTAQVLVAQSQIRVTGKVIDSKDKSPLRGATIAFQDGKKVVVANQEGAFEMTVPDGSYLKVTMIGYDPNVVKATTNMIISMTASAETLGDVVVMGYGTQKKELLTASVGIIKFDEVKRNIPTQQLGNLLAGQVAGVSVSTPRGIPGSDPGISVRQKSSWNTQNVLYVIDGRIADGGEFNRLSPNEVDNITVLKDAASTAVYGSRAAAGVIVVTTRRGKSGKASIEYSYQTGFDRRGRNSDLMNAVQYFEYQNRISPNKYSQNVIDKFKTINDGWGYDQLSAVWNDPSTTTHNLSITGGSDKVQYFIGGSMSKEQLFLKNMNWQNYSVRANVKAQIATGLTAEALLSLNNNIQKFPSADGWDDIYGKLRIWQAYQPVWTTDGNPIDYGWIQNVGAEVRGDNGYKNVSAVRPVANLRLNYQIPGIKGLSVAGQYSKSFFNQRQRSFVKQYNMWVMKTTDQYLISTDPNDFVSFKKSYHTNSLSERYDWSTNYQLNLQLSYENTFKDVHHVKAWLIYERTGADGSWMQGTRERFPVYVSDQWRFTSGDRADSYINGSTQQPTGRKSYIGQLFYDYNSKYLATFAYRYDGSMQFAPDMRWGFFPSGSLGWIVSKENFFKSNKIDMLKLRMSAGLVGNDGVGGWQWQESYDQGKNAYLGTGGATGVGIKYGALVNPALTWEKTLNYNAGVDVNFLKHFNASLEYFSTKTYDILGSRIQTVPPTFSRSLPSSNYGEIKAQGIELGLGYKGQARKVNYYVNGVASYSNAKNIIKDLNITYPWQNEIGRSTSRISTRVADKILRTQADLDAWNAANPNYTYYGYKAAIGQLVFKDISGPDGKPDGIVDDWDQVEWRRNNNPIVVGLNFGASWKGLSLDISFNGSFNYYQSIRPLNQNVEWNRNWVKWATDAWTPQNTNASLPIRYSSNDGKDRINRDESSFWMKKSNWLRCKYISLAYSLPQNWVNKASLSGARIFFNATNPFIISKFNKLYYDPEIGNPNNFPIMRTFNFGASVTY